MSDLAASRKAAIMLLSDVPRRTDYHPKGATFRGPECVPTEKMPDVAPGCVIAKEEMEEELEPMFQIWSDLAGQANIFFFNFYQLLCGPTQCDAMVPGTSTLAYMDTNHLTRGGAHYLRPYLCAAMTKA